MVAPLPLMFVPPSVCVVPFKKTARVLWVNVPLFVKFPPTYKSPLVAFKVAPPLETLNAPPIPLLVVGNVRVVEFCE